VKSDERLGIFEPMSRELREYIGDSRFVPRTELALRFFESSEEPSG
jgi:hypothetical protein